MAEMMTPCPFCSHSGPFDEWPCEWLDKTEANVIRCPICHGAAPAATWNRRHLTQPAQAVDAGAIREVIGTLRADGVDWLADQLTRAISNAQAVDVGAEVSSAWREAAASCLGRRSMAFRRVCEEADKLTRAIGKVK
jgi:hypothetical protein